MRFEIDRCRGLYRSAEEGSRCCRRPRPGACTPPSRCTRASCDRIEDADYDVFSHRARVPTRPKVFLAARAAAGRRG